MSDPKDYEVSDEELEEIIEWIEEEATDEDVEVILEVLEEEE